MFLKMLRIVTNRILNSPFRLLLALMWREAPSVMEMSVVSLSLSIFADAASFDVSASSRSAAVGGELCSPSRWSWSGFICLRSGVCEPSLSVSRVRLGDRPSDSSERFSGSELRDLLSGEWLFNMAGVWGLETLIALWCSSSAKGKRINNLN